MEKKASMPETVQLQSAAGTYEVQIGCGLLNEIGVRTAAVCQPGKIAIISDENVSRIFAPAVEKALTEAGFSVSTFVFSPGENHKTLATVSEILNFISQERLTRSDLILALGGGICGDMAGFAAAVYLRGIRFIQVPTTLLAMVDASVGGKTAVNLPLGKNLAGAFWQPSLVVCDPDTLQSLPAALLADGLAESIKHGMIADRGLFELLESSDPAQNWEAIIARNIHIKSKFVAADTFDRGERQLLNYGHTFGHAVEKASSFSISHGSAVAIGMLMAAKAAEKLGISQDPEISGRLSRLLEKFNLPRETSLPVEQLIDAALSDKKRSDGQINFVFPETIGKCVLAPMPDERIPEIFRLAAA